MPQPVTLGDLAHKYEAAKGAEHLGAWAAALVRAKGQPDRALGIMRAAKRYSPGVLAHLDDMVTKASLGAVTTSTDSGALSNDPSNIGRLFLDFIRPKEVLGKLTMARRVVPRMPILSGVTGATAAWRAEGAAIRITHGTFERTMLELLSVAGITVVTDEVARSDDPRALVALTRDLSKAVVFATDGAFLDFQSAGTPGIEPPGIAYGGLEIQRDATLTDDLNQLLEAVGGLDWSGIALITSPRCALYLAQALNVEGLGLNGGSLWGIPVIVSAASPTETDTSGTREVITAINMDELLVTEGDGVEVETTNEANLKMDTAPGMNGTTPTETNTVSLFQSNLTAVRCIRAVNWRMRTPGIGAAVLTGVDPLA